MVCYTYAPAPSFALITYTVWPKFFIPRRDSAADAAVGNPRIRKIRREMVEYRHGTTPFILPVKTNTGTEDWPCVVVPHVSEVGA